MNDVVRRFFLARNSAVREALGAVALAALISLPLSSPEMRSGLGSLAMGAVQLLIAVAGGRLILQLVPALLAGMSAPVHREQARIQLGMSIFCLLVGLGTVWFFSAGVQQLRHGSGRILHAWSATRGDLPRTPESAQRASIEAHFNARVEPTSAPARWVPVTVTATATVTSRAPAIEASTGRDVTVVIEPP